MSVFLRWGIFGILGVAAMVYAYNASKRMAEKHAQNPAPAAQIAAAAPVADNTPAPPPVTQPVPPAEAPPPEHCQAELVVAQRAIEARRNGEPLDRVLRMQEIAFQESARRTRLEKVATRYFNYAGEFSVDALRIAVISDCVQSSP